MFGELSREQHLLERIIAAGHVRLLLQCGQVGHGRGVEAGEIHDDDDGSVALM